MSTVASSGIGAVVFGPAGALLFPNFESLRRVRPDSKRTTRLLPNASRSPLAGPWPRWKGAVSKEKPRWAKTDMNFCMEANR